MDKINICFHIGNITNCGGTEKVTTQIASLLLDQYQDYNITILSSYYDSKKEIFFKGNERIKYDKIFDEEINLKKNYFKMIKKLNQYIKRNNVDVLIGVDTMLALFDIPAIKGTKCKYIAWEHFNYNYNLGKKLRDFGRKYAAKRADALVVLTDKDKDYFNNNLRIRNKLIRIYNPFINNEKEVKYNKKSNIIMSSGRLTYQKGFDMLIEVAKKLKDKTEDFKWNILGDGEDKEVLQSKIKENGLSKFVELKGKVKNVEDYYKESKMFVLTSRFEGLGIVVLEAKSYLLPVVSFDCDCGPSEMIEENINGYLIEEFDISKMAERIYELLKDKDKCERFSEKAKVNMKKFNPDEIVKQWNELIKEVVSK